jgi:branched-chain amino acid transport system substrate-binding protein
MRSRAYGGQILAAALAVCAPVPAIAQQPFPAVVVSVVELSGDGAIPANNFNNGLQLAFKEINAAGGILGTKIEVISLDTQTKTEVTKAALNKAAEMNAYAVMGPVISGMVLASMEEIRRNEIPTFIGADAASITQQGNPYIFRSSLSQAATMPKLARYLKNGLRAETVAMAWVDNDFGRGGREAMTKALAAEGLKLVADLQTTPDQTDFTDVVAKMVASRADVAFVYLNEDEAALALRELHDQAYSGSVVGETTLISQSVIDLAGEEATNGIRGHTGMSPDALLPLIREASGRFLQEYKYKGDHNAMKGYSAAYILKAATEKVGKFDKKELANVMRGLVVSAKDHPGILLDVKYDDRGDLDRVSFIVRVNGRHQEMIAILPAAAGAF